MPPTPVVVAVALLAAGCGRFDFEPPLDAPLEGPSEGPPEGLPPFVPCFADNFDDGDVSDWTVLQSSWSTGTGVAGSPGLFAGAQFAYEAVTHPELSGFTDAALSFDVLLGDVQQGDFIVYFLRAGWQQINPDDPPRTEGGFRASLFVVDGDTTPDDLAVLIAPQSTNVIVEATPQLRGQQWHRITILFRGGSGSLDLAVDGLPHLVSGPNPELAGPIEIVLQFWSGGALDNVELDCIR